MAYETVVKGSTQRARWIPEGILETKLNEYGVVYIYQNGRGRMLAIAYAGAAGKPAWHYTFHQTPQGLDKARRVANEFLLNLEAHQQRKQAEKAARNAPHGIQVGAIIYNSWGYDQTNIDWYRVVARTDHFVSLQGIPGVKTIDGGVGPMSGYTRPDQDAEPFGEITKHAVHGQHNSVNFKHGSGSVWDGTAKYESWYA